MQSSLFGGGPGTGGGAGDPPDAARGGAEIKDPKVQKLISRGLDWIASTQSRLGHWTANEGRYPTAMTALAGMALLSEGSTTTQGKYSKNIRRAVDYLLSRSRANGLIGDPARDDRYTYGHGYSMLFLSQVLGEEEDESRRKELIDVLTRAVEFTGQAQTAAGGWGYVSAKDGSGFDEGSTTITQVQGLRGCRNAGIPVPKEIIDKAINYIRKCTLPDGGVQYSSKGGGGRPAITAAAIACLFNAGDYDSEYVPKLQDYCRPQPGRHLQPGFRPLALRPLLLRPGAVSRRGQGLGGLPRQDRTPSWPLRPRTTANTSSGTRATSARSTPPPST